MKTEVSTTELIDRYRGFDGARSTQFAMIVDMLVAQMIQNKIAPDEIRDAAFIASIKFLQMHPVDTLYVRDDLR